MKPRYLHRSYGPPGVGPYHGNTYTLVTPVVKKDAAIAQTHVYSTGYTGMFYAHLR
jgi:hypothetical protein